MNKTKLVISSAYLADSLRLIDFDDERITDAVIKEGMLLLITNHGDLSFPCEFTGSGDYTQESVRWDWIRQTAEELSEQPITLCIGDNFAKMELNF